MQVSTSPVSPYRDELDLPLMAEELRDKFVAVFSNADFKVRQETVPKPVTFARLGSSAMHEFDETAETAKAEQIFD